MTSSFDSTNISDIPTSIADTQAVQISAQWLGKIKKTSGVSNRCACKTAKLPRTELCGCLDCQNAADTESDVDANEDSAAISDVE